MSPALKNIIEKEMNSMSVEDKFFVLDKIYSSLADNSAEEENVWKKEVAEQVKLYEQGKLETVPSKESLKQAWAILGK